MAGTARGVVSQLTGPARLRANPLLEAVEKLNPLSVMDRGGPTNDAIGGANEIKYAHRHAVNWVSVRDDAVKDIAGSEEPVDTKKLASIINGGKRELGPFADRIRG